ncbi:CPBP family intramembrane metalloprotease [Schleiferilactobacillus harbinensis]|uniref:CPBP family intramembrane glutamic endopeptidase n=1 Tax=Schleiferilactobacillus harbinensis TaxID=304207 RepID=UPI001AAE46AD|nr:CPBP family intramembrane glutamic endopeptidase [Schleiferilactobacillus harbinensis]MBO3093096.1 CPBP family intramembrane metalloprotease [Schleiferilactobacillus harbinensis]
MRGDVITKSINWDDLLSNIKSAYFFRIIFFWLTIVCFDDLVSVPLLLQINLPDWILQIPFKGLEILAAIFANHWLTKQSVCWQTKVGANSRFFIGSLVLISVLTGFQHRGRLAVAIVEGISVLSEDYIFRGVIFGALLTRIKVGSQKHRLLIAMIGSSLLFALYHIGNARGIGLYPTFLQMIGAFGLGCLFNALYVRKTSLIFPMVLHGTLDYLSTLMWGRTTMVSPGTTLFTVLISMGITILIAMIVLRPVGNSDLQRFIGQLDGGRT